MSLGVLLVCFSIIIALKEGVYPGLIDVFFVRYISIGVAVKGTKMQSVILKYGDA